MARHKSIFTKFAKLVSQKAGHPGTFMTALGLIILWAVTGPIFKYSDTWQLVINTSTTIITFLMVFLIQNTQNRDSESLHIKVDELIRATEQARNSLLNLEDLEQDELDEVREQFIKLSQEGILNLSDETDTTPNANP